MLYKLHLFLNTRPLNNMQLMVILNALARTTENRSKEIALYLMSEGYMKS